MSDTVQPRIGGVKLYGSTVDGAMIDGMDDSRVTLAEAAKAMDDGFSIRKSYWKDSCCTKFKGTLPDGTIFSIEAKVSLSIKGKEFNVHPIEWHEEVSHVEDITNKDWVIIRSQHQAYESLKEKDDE